MNLSYTSFLVGLCCIRGGVMTRSKLYILSPSKHNQNWKGQTLFSMVTSHIHELIFDIDINSSYFICILKRQTCLQPQHFEFFSKPARTYNLPSPNMPHQTNVSWDYYEYSIAQTIYVWLYILSWGNHDWANEKSKQIGLVFSSFQFKLHHSDLLQHYF